MLRINMQGSAGAVKWKQLFINRLIMPMRMVMREATAPDVAGSQFAVGGGWEVGDR